jgi:ribosomal-protein-serine acetyltransferase
MFFYFLSDLHTLRLLCPNDAAELFALTDGSRHHLREWLPWLDEIQEVADTEKFIDFTLRQYSTGQGLVAAILYDGAIAGVLGYNSVDQQNRIGHIGYWLGQDYQGQGLMTNSCKALIEYGFTALNLNRLVISCATENYASRAIPKRLGFDYEGTARDAEWLYDRFVDHEIYALLRVQIQLPIDFAAPIIKKELP